MSQINDALKRAGEAPEQPPLPGGPPPLPLPTSVPAGGFRTIAPPPTSSGLPLPVIIVCAALVAIVGLAAFLLARGWARKSSHAAGESLPRAVARKRATNPTPTPGPAPQSPAAKPAPAAANVAVPPLNPVVAPNGKPLVAPAGTNGFPALKVQGIFYRAKNPSAMINGKSLFVGDHVAGATIVAITADSVTVELNGAKKVLTLY